MKPSLRIGTCAAFTLLLAACDTTRQIQPPTEIDALVPDTWREEAGSTLSRDWIDSFSSPTLTELIADAEQNNFGLEAAYQRTRAAEAAARISGSLRLPSLNAGLRSSRAQTMASFSPPTSIETESHALSLSARWEVDLWNRLGQEHLASRSEYQASQYDFESLRLSLASQVAKAWFNAIEAHAQYELATASAESFETNLATLERRYSRGLVDAFDLRLTRAQASSSRANAVRRRSQMDTTIRNLETLLGRYPSATLLATGELPELGNTPPAGLPSELLTRRPDVLAQQNRLIAALALEKSAKRNWLPSLALTASDGTLSPDFSNLLEKDFNVWSLAGDVSAALFQSGRLKAQRDQLNANQLSQLAQYKDLVLRAFREVETALRSETDLSDLETQTQIAADENRSAEEQAWRLYERGLVDITTVLDAERRSFEARSQLISIRNQRLQNRINLHVALGGNLD
ncbi:efflux transporter, outer membrane factor lipoprotein, NodT family [Verrucomicrobiia bacterium DG1235]|nr:efflux transporter, outer membrane factor lipoprotein, NodT family [Verrucomicrobiae bacterium DG1235]